MSQLSIIPIQYKNSAFRDIFLSLNIVLLICSPTKSHAIGDPGYDVWPCLDLLQAKKVWILLSIYLMGLPLPDDVLSTTAQANDYSHRSVWCSW